MMIISVAYLEACLKGALSVWSFNMADPPSRASLHWKAVGGIASGRLSEKTTVDLGARNGL